MHEGPFLGPSTSHMCGVRTLSVVLGLDEPVQHVLGGPALNAPAVIVSSSAPVVQSCVRAGRAAQQLAASQINLKYKGRYPSISGQFCKVFPLLPVPAWCNVHHSKCKPPSILASGIKLFACMVLVFCGKGHEASRQNRAIEFQLP